MQHKLLLFISVFFIPGACSKNNKPIPLFNRKMIFSQEYLSNLIPNKGILKKANCVEETCTQGEESLGLWEIIEDNQNFKILKFEVFEKENMKNFYIIEKKKKDSGELFLGKNVELFEFDKNIILYNDIGLQSILSYIKGLK